MRYAEDSVNSPAAQRRTFSYSIPPNLSIQPGQAVWIPFGERLLQGLVMELTEYPAVEETRDILDVIDPDPVLSPERRSSGNFIHSRAIILACKPYYWINDFSPTVRNSREEVEETKKKWGKVIFGDEV